MTLTPEQAVARLVDILAARAEFTEAEVYAALTESGMESAVADRAYKFTQIAWGRAFLKGMGIRFAPDYFCLNAAGEIIESGQLAEQPYFVAAVAVARRLPPPVGLPRFALMSADVRGVNELLNGGSKPENIAIGPPVLFMEPPTPAGIERAQRVLSEGVSASNKKPWWRFW
jgi:hypothetical protein